MKIKEAASSIQHITSKCKTDPREAELRCNISQAMVSLLHAQDPGSARTQKRMIRNQKRKLQRLRKRLRVQTLSKRTSQDTYSAVEFELQNEKTTDVKEWPKALHAFGKARFSNDENSQDQHILRLQKFLSIAAAERLDGCPPPDLHIFDFLQARASMSLDKGVGSDGVPMEAYRAIPWRCTLHVYHLFKQRLKCQPAGESPFWGILQFFRRAESERCKDLR